MKKRISVMLISLLVLALLAGCAGGEKSADARQEVPSSTQAMGALILSVNPRVEISYNLNGLVIGLKGLNEDGEKIVAAYGDYAGQTCREATCGLIEEMEKAGYFYSDTGEQKQIVLQLAAGSLCPDDGFLEEVTEGVKKTVRNLSNGEDTTLTLPVPSATSEPERDITLEEAKKIALHYLLLSEDAEVTFTGEKLEGQVYELEFIVNDVHYEAEISLRGQVLKMEAEVMSPTPMPDDSGFITLEEAKKIALEEAGLSGKTDALVVKEELDRRDGKFDFEILWGGYEYELEINARTGDILKREVETTKRTAPDMSLRKVSFEEARAVVLRDLGIGAALFDKEEYDAFEEEYELELTVDGVRYEYTISAWDGDILEKEWQGKKKARSTPAPDATDFIGMDKAKELVLKHAKLTGKKVTYKEAKLDREDGRYVYEIEFVYGGMEYEYEVDAATGKILKADKEKDD